MKRNTTRLLLVLLLMLSLCFLCTACGGGAGSVESAKSVESAESAKSVESVESAKSTESVKSTENVKSSTTSPQDDPNEGLGDRITEDDEPDSNDSGNGDGSYSWDPELCQKNVSEFEGVWYYDGDLSATTYIVIDGSGNWSYYQRVPGDAEGTEMDHGTFSYSTDEVGTYYADSAEYDGVRFRMYDQDQGVLLWEGDTYYRME